MILKPTVEVDEADALVWLSFSLALNVGANMIYYN